MFRKWNIALMCMWGINAILYFTIFFTENCADYDSLHIGLLCGLLAFHNYVDARAERDKES